MPGNLTQRLLPFLGGLVVGAVVGVLFLSGFALEVATGYPFPFIAGIVVLTFLGGAMVGWRVSPKPREPRLTGRVFDFPQGLVMVEIALKRAKSIIPVKVTSSE